MPNYSRGDVLLVRYPFTDLSGVKVRPAVVIQAPHPSQDNFVVPLTSRLIALQPGEFALEFGHTDNFLHSRFLSMYFNMYFST